MFRFFLPFCSRNSFPFLPRSCPFPLGIKSFFRQKVFFPFSRPTKMGCRRFVILNAPRPSPTSFQYFSLPLAPADGVDSLFFANLPTQRVITDVPEARDRKRTLSCRARIHPPLTSPSDPVLPHSRPPFSICHLTRARFAPKGPFQFAPRRRRLGRPPRSPFFRGEGPPHMLTDPTTSQPQSSSGKPIRLRPLGPFFCLVACDPPPSMVILRHAGTLE